VIGRLRGELIEVEANRALVECGGVGYDVQIPESVAALLPPAGETVILLTRQTFREDAVVLYGFTEPFQRRLFDLLLTVTGCGPKAAMALIGQLGEDSVATAIVAQDARVLRRATGVGAKLAERILLELKDKMQEETFLRKVGAAVRPAKPTPTDDELVEALLALGYRRNEAEGAAERARDQADDVQGQIRAALSLLTK
jgi:Holliday junction DNA helicase RuvA